MKNDHWSQWQDFFRCLVTAASNADLYDTDNPQVLHLCSRARTISQDLIGAGQSAGLLLLDEDVIIGEAPLPATLHTTRFSTILRGRGIEHLRIFHGITEGELMKLVLALSRRGQTSAPLQSGKHLVFGVLDLPEDAGGAAAPGQGEILSHGDPIAAEAARFAEICDNARKHRPVNIMGLSEIVAKFILAFDRELPQLQMVIPLRVMDEYTFTHAANVCLLNLAQGKSLGLEPALLHDIGLAGLLHDIGKLFVPEEIIRKPGKPTEEEWEILRRHPTQGACYLLETSGIPHLCAITAYEHHIKYDRSGYPRVPDNWRQHLSSHMTTISDIFDALCTKRSYRDPVRIRETAGFIQGLAGTELHPRLTENFLGVIERNLQGQESETVPSGRSL